MLGCVATALANKAASPASFPDNFGDNVQLQRRGHQCNTDPACVRVWRTVLCGDGHAQQGGEVLGSDNEASLDAEFCVDLVARVGSNVRRARQVT